MAEFRTFGPPGTGKTTWISRQVNRALNKYDPDDICCCSFTRAAASEIAGRDTGLPKSNVGTIHSLCYHALDCPPLMEVEPGLTDEWNEHHPNWQVEDSRGMGDQAAALSLLQAYNRRRAEGRTDPDDLERVTLRHKLSELQPFIDAWETFKSDHGAYDFTDLLLDAPPSIGAKVLFVDEAQDLTPLQWKIVRQWGAQASTFVVAGDDDQCLYSFLSASPESFLTELPEENKRFLSQSYRLPRAVYEYAEAWIEKLGDRRQPKDYQPRDVEGAVEKRSMKLGTPARLVSELQDRADEGQTCMILASCSYMLQSLISRLRAEGLPYHNPYRRKRGDWNPLKTTGERLLAFLRCGEAAREDRIPPAVDWWQWIEMLRAKKTLQYGAKSEIEARARENERITWDELEEWVTADLIDALLDDDLSWVAENTTSRFGNAITYPLKIYKNCGERGLRQTPRIILGTVHSVKGGEADVVYLAPDLSYQAYEQVSRRGREAKDALVRMAYVGMTRAKLELHLLKPTGKYFLKWE